MYLHSFKNLEQQWSKYKEYLQIFSGTSTKMMLENI